MKLVLVALVVLFAGLTAAAMTIWLERRVLALVQDRYGPNRVGPFGLLQVVADAVKMLGKEDWIPPFADKPLFVLAPALGLLMPLLALAVVPWSPALAVLPSNVGVLFFLAVSSLAAYSVVLAGWSSRSKFALLGGLRAAAQVLSYEVFMGLALAGVVVLAGSFDLRVIVEAQRGVWNVVPQFLGFAVFYVAALAETRRLPFDLPESESELVAGFHSEYSGLKFGMFFVGEYVAIWVAASLITVLFLGGWLGPILPGAAWFALKAFLVACSFIVVRAALPRPRYDQLMRFGWLVLLPVALANLLVTGALVLARSG
jgi:NADH-quinone oxidoreductase subunit H